MGRASGPGRADESAASGAGHQSYYSISQAAGLLGVSRVTIWRWIRAGRLFVVRLGHRTIRISRDDIERLLLHTGKAPTPWMIEAQADREAPHADWSAVGAGEHFVQFYESDSFLLDAVAGYVGAGLAAGEAGVVVATRDHLAGVEERLGASGLAVDVARAAGRYVGLDAADTLARLMVDGMPDADRFVGVIGQVVDRATAGGRPVRIFGEMVALLAVAGNLAATVRLEELWNELRKARHFSLFCAYPMRGLGGENYAELFGSVCAEHTRVIPAESYTELSSQDERLRTIAVLQQKARTLEAEIAQRKAAEERLRIALTAERTARAAAEDALRVRDEFLSIAAHELRTPVTSVRGFSQLILRRMGTNGHLDPDRVVPALQAISSQSEKLSRLLGQLLDVSRLEAGRLDLEPQPTDLARLVERTVEIARAGTEVHAIALDAPDSLEIAADALRLEQVLTNLLDNAIKYSPDGGAIDVVLARVDDAAVELSVRDRGLGIPSEQREQIFERFYQAHANGHRSGMGLGLYISRQIVELHGGEIRVEFPADGGTRFVVRLPLEAATVRDESPALSAAAG